MLLVVNYHYVGTPDYSYPGIHSLSVDEFLTQLLGLQEHFELIGIPEIISALGKGLPKKVCLITFDDGLRCQYEVIIPLMEKYGFPAAFFVSTQPLLEQRATAVHKAQYVRAHFPPEQIFQCIVKTASELDFSFRSCPDKEVKAHYRYDDLEIAKVKYLMNYVMPQTIVDKVIDILFKELIEDESLFCSQWYMTAREVIELHHKFGCIGSHAYSHRPLASLSQEECYAELLESKAALEEIIGDRVHSVSYPLGNENAVGRREGELARAAGYHIGFTMERADNPDLRDPLLLARLDSNDIPGGKHPLFKICNGKLLGLPERSRYLKEFDL